MILYCSYFNKKKTNIDIENNEDDIGNYFLSKEF